MNENASDENTVTGKAMGNIVGLGATALMVGAGAFMGVSAVGKAKNGISRAISRKGATEELSEVGKAARNVMKDNPGMSGRKATKEAEKQILNKQIAEYDDNESAKKIVNKAKNNSKKTSGATTNSSNAKNQSKETVDMTSKDLTADLGIDLSNADTVKGYEDFLRNDTATRNTKTANVIPNGIVQ